MRRILIKFIALLIIFFTLLIVEAALADSKEQIEMVTTYVAKKEIKCGTAITTSDFEAVEIPRHIASTYIIQSAPSGYLLVDIAKGEFVYHHQISDQSPIHIEEDERMITLQCDVVEGNGFLFDLNEYVDLVMIHKEEKIIIEDAYVCRILDENLKSEKRPMYISFIVKTEDALVYFQNISTSKVFISKKQ